MQCNSDKDSSSSSTSTRQLTGNAKHGGCPVRVPCNAVHRGLGDDDALAIVAQLHTVGKVKITRKRACRACKGGRVRRRKRKRMSPNKMGTASSLDSVYWLIGDSHDAQTHVCGTLFTRVTKTRAKSW